jgi:ADP-heptose:LPS heptosyltransferase
MIIIAPYAQKLRTGKENPKNYPHWEELVYELQKSMHVVQIGVEGEQQLVPDFRKNLPIADLRKLVHECDTWIGVDSFFQHLAWDEGKPGIVLWGPSDPLIFGHPENINLLKDRSYLVESQFLWWEATEHDPERFVSPTEVLHFLNKEKPWHQQTQS